MFGVVFGHCGTTFFLSTDLFSFSVNTNNSVLPSLCRSKQPPVCVTGRDSSGASACVNFHSVISQFHISPFLPVFS